MKKLKKALVTVVLLMVITLLAGCNSKVAMNLNDYITFSSEGYNSVGKASFQFDKEAFDRDFAGKVKLTSAAKKILGDASKEVGDNAHRMLINQYVDMYLDQDNMLSNGDTVSLRWKVKDEKIAEYFNVELTYSDMTYQVENLPAIGTMDPFEGFTVEFSGTSPFGEAQGIADTTKEENQYFSYHVKDDSYLKNGDEVTVVASMVGSDMEFIEKFGAVPGTTEKKFTVEGLPYYADKAECITEDALESMKQVSIAEMQNHIENYWEEYEKFQSMNYLGFYFLETKDATDRDQNYIYLVYEVKLTAHDIPVTYYYYTRFHNAIVNADGTCTVDVEDYRVPSDTYYPEDTDTYYYGYEKLDELFEYCVEENSDYYTYESTVVVPEQNVPEEGAAEETLDADGNVVTDGTAVESTEASEESTEEAKEESVEESKTDDESAASESDEEKASEEEKNDKDKTDKDKASDKDSKKSKK